MRATRPMLPYNARSISSMPFDLTASSSTQFKKHVKTRRKLFAPHADRKILWEKGLATFTARFSRMGTRAGAK
jgi:hypothetical protein